ncbi:hypothetical protein BGZ76_007371, partial [Entomortierella beljakovae]
MSGYPPSDNTISIQIDSTPATLSRSPSQHSTNSSSKAPRQISIGGRIKSLSYSSSTSSSTDQNLRHRSRENVSEKGQLPILSSSSPGDKDEIVEDKAVLDGGKEMKREVEESPDTSKPDEVNDTWTDRIHMHRPDRHLFPYRSAKENWHALGTFLRRFFFLFLVFPAWILPNILEAQAKHAAEASHGSGGEEGGIVEGNTTGISHHLLQYGGLKYVTLASAEAGAAHGPELSKGAYWAIFLLNMFLMMHLGKAAGAALEELVPKYGP